MTFPKRLKALRLKAGLTISELASRTDINRSTYGDMEIGRKVQGEGAYLSLCKVFDCSLEYLLYGHKNKKDKILKQLTQLEEEARNIKKQVIESDSCKISTTVNDTDKEDKL